MLFSWLKEGNVSGRPILTGISKPLNYVFRLKEETSFKPHCFYVLLPPWYKAQNLARCLHQRWEKVPYMQFSSESQVSGIKSQASPESGGPSKSSPSVGLVIK